MYIRRITRDYLWGKVIHIFSISNIDNLYFHLICPKGFFPVCMYVLYVCPILDLVCDSSSYFKENVFQGQALKKLTVFTSKYFRVLLRDSSVCILNEYAKPFWLWSSVFFVHKWILDGKCVCNCVALVYICQYCLVFLQKGRLCTLEYTHDLLTCNVHWLFISWCLKKVFKNVT